MLSSLCQLFVSTFLFSVIPQKSWKPKEPATNNCHKSIISNSVLYQIIRCIKKQLLISVHMCVKLSLVLPYSVGGSPSSQEY